MAFQFINRLTCITIIPHTNVDFPVPEQFQQSSQCYKIRKICEIHESVFPRENVLCVTIIIIVEKCDPSKIFTLWYIHQSPINNQVCLWWRNWVDGLVLLAPEVKDGEIIACEIVSNINHLYVQYVHIRVKIKTKIPLVC